MADIVPVAFHGATILAVLVNGVPHVSLKSIAEALGLDWKSQYARIQRHPVLKSTMVVTTTVAADGKRRELITLPLDKLNGWLFGVSVARVRPELRDKLVQYQRECFDVLAAHFGTKPQPTAVAPLLNQLRASEIAQHAAMRVRRSVYRAAMDGAGQQRRRFLLEVEVDEAGEPVVNVRHLADEVQVATWQELIKQLEDAFCEMPMQLAQDLAEAAAWKAFRMSAHAPRGRGAELAEQLRNEKLPLADLYAVLNATMTEQTRRLKEMSEAARGMPRLEGRPS